MKLQNVAGDGSARRRLDLAAWHNPLCTVIVTHREYSGFAGDALLSVLEQRYRNWECIVVDDFSSELHRNRLRELVAGLSDKRFRLIENSRQLGQIETFFVGLAESSGEFVSPMDPDDRLHPSYLGEMVQAHLNDTVFCPLASCEQQLLRLDGALLTGTLRGGVVERENPSIRDEPLTVDVAGAERPIQYHPGKERGWLWTTTSALMVRRGAARLLNPHKHFDVNVALDGYLGFGAHFLGGTLLVPKPLIYRGLHGDNDYIAENIFSMSQRKARPEAVDRYPVLKRYAVAALFHNGVTRLFRQRYLGEVLCRHFDAAEMALVGEECPEALRIWQAHRPPKKEGAVRQALHRWLGATSAPTD